MAEPEEVVGEEEVEPEVEPTDEKIAEQNQEDLPAYMREEEPSGKLDKAKYWLLKGKSREQLIDEGHNEGTVRIAVSQLIRDGQMKKQPKKLKAGAGTAVATQTGARGIQTFAKGSPPEAIIDSISIPMVDGQGVGFEKGMKFGMSTLVLAVRIMQELSSVAQGQVKPLIDLTRAVREGEASAFKSGADEAAMKAASAMGQTILPMISDMQSTINGVVKGSEGDPVKSMMVRTMEPLINAMMKRLLPGTETPVAAGWTRKSG